MLGIQDLRIGHGCDEELISGIVFFRQTDLAGEGTIDKSILLEILQSGGHQPLPLLCTLLLRASALSDGNEDTMITIAVSTCSIWLTSSDMETLRLGDWYRRAWLGITLSPFLPHETSTVSAPLFPCLIFRDPCALSSMGFPDHSPTVYNDSSSRITGHIGLLSRRSCSLCSPPTSRIRQQMD